MRRGLAVDNDRQATLTSSLYVPWRLTMRSKQETLVSTVLIASMVAIAGSVLFRTFRAPVSVAREVARPTTPELIPYWTEARRAGLLMGVIVLRQL